MSRYRILILLALISTSVFAQDAPDPLTGTWHFDLIEIRVTWINGIVLRAWPESEVPWIDAAETFDVQQYIIESIEFVEPGFLRVSAGEASGLKTYSGLVFRQDETHMLPDIRFRIAGDGKNPHMVDLLFLPDRDGTYKAYDTGGEHHRIYRLSRTDD
jgi:hypothetical protein